jgi:hypothetical protein
VFSGLCGDLRKVVQLDSTDATLRGKARTRAAYLTVAHRWLFGRRRRCPAHAAAQTLNLGPFVPPIQDV